MQQHTMEPTAMGNSFPFSSRIGNTASSSRPLTMTAMDHSLPFSSHIGNTASSNRPLSMDNYKHAVQLNENHMDNKSKYKTKNKVELRVSFPENSI